MSTVHGPARNRAVRQAAVERPLSVVPRAAPRRPRAPFVVLVVALMAVGLVGLLLINTNMQRKAFELANLQEQARNLETRQQALQLEVNALSSPDWIASEAGRLGMVPNASPAFLRLEDGEVLGHPRAALPGTNLPGLAAPPPSTDATDDRGDSTRDHQGDSTRSDGGDGARRDEDEGARADESEAARDDDTRAGSDGRERQRREHR